MTTIQKFLDDPIDRWAVPPGPGPEVDMIESVVKYFGCIGLPLSAAFAVNSARLQHSKFLFHFLASLLDKRHSKAHYGQNMSTDDISKEFDECFTDRASLYDLNFDFLTQCWTDLSNFSSIVCSDGLPICESMK